MKAVIYNQYGPPEVLQLAEVEKPVPAANEIRVRIRATAVNSADWRLRKADPFLVRLMFGLTKPKRKILGIVLAGEVEQVGANITRYKTGDQVFGMATMKMGAYAEYICLPEDAPLAPKPPQLRFEAAASIPFGAHTALHFLRQLPIEKGQKFLIYGASGAVGTAAIQLAKHHGAEVTAVCSTANLDLVRSLGADKVIDYTREDVAQCGETFDVVFDTVGKTSALPFAKLLQPKGTLILGAAMGAQALQGLWISMSSGIKVLTGTAKVNAEDMRFLGSLIASGELKPVIDKTFPLEQMVEAHRYVEAGHKKGNVAILVP
jgi:NADPH:quinone reductase-like Zn-dependent oxidoreductase